MAGFEDISLRCNVCKSYYALSSVMDHRKHHKAMRILRYKEGKGPKNIESLSKRHLVISKRILAKFKDKPLDPNLMRRIEKINGAFENLRFELTKDDSLLRSMLVQDGMTSMRDGYFEPRDKVEDNDIVDQSVCTNRVAGFPSCVVAIGHCEATNKEWRDEMEDRIAIKPIPMAVNTQQSKGACYVGLFDGYHGTSAAETCAQNMHRIIAEEISLSMLQCHESELLTSYNHAGDAGMKSTFLSDKESNENTFLSDRQMSKCLSRSFTKMDDYLGYGINETSRSRWSGCSALTCLFLDEIEQLHNDNKEDGKSDGELDRINVKPASKKLLKNKWAGKLYVSNSGDVEAVLYHNKKPYRMSEKHCLENEKERDRVLAAGGSVSQSEKHARVNGLIHTTRGLGNHGDLLNKKSVIASPHTSVARLTSESQMVVIASNSFWKVLNPNDVYSIIMHSIPSGSDARLRTGPTPIVPVMHGHHRGRRGASMDGSDTHQPLLSSTLPSIVETEEEEAIEEVIFVDAQDSDSDEDIGKEETTSDTIATSLASVSSNTEHVSDATVDGKTRKSVEGQTGSVESSSSKVGKLDTASSEADAKHDEKRIWNEIRSQVARELSEKLVRAAICAGCIDNMSVIIVLLEAFPISQY